jgi:hypothetical protein
VPKGHPLRPNWKPDQRQPCETGDKRGAALSRAKITAALRRAHRRDPEAKARQIQEILRAPQLRQPPQVQGAYAAIVSGQVRLITELNTQIAELGEVVAAHFGRHPDAEIYASQPGLGADVPAEY